MRHAKRTDANHAAIRQAFRDLGWTVEDLSHVGHGVPDLYVERVEGHSKSEYGTRWLRAEFIEVKDGSKPPSARRVTKDGQWFHELLRRAGVTVRVIERVEQVAEL